MNGVRDRARAAVDLLRDAAAGWGRHEPLRLAASLSYYTIFSLAPLIIIVTGVAGLVFGEEAARGQLDEQLRGLMGPDAASFVQRMVASLNQAGSGTVAALTGIVALLLGATAVVLELQAALDIIFEYSKRTAKGWGDAIRGRLTALALVVAIGFLLLVSLLLSAAVSAAGAFFGALLPVPAILLEMVSFIVSFALTAALFALVFKVLPDVPLGWHDVRVGAVVTALFFTVGKLLIGLYLGRSAIASTYGAAGAFVIVLLWVYYSAVMLFFGAEVTVAWARRYGSLATKPAERKLRRVSRRP